MTVSVAVPVTPLTVSVAPVFWTASVTGAAADVAVCATGSVALAAAVVAGSAVGAGSPAWKPPLVVGSAAVAASLAGAASACGCWAACCATALCSFACDTAFADGPPPWPPWPWAGSTGAAGSGAAVVVASGAASAGSGAAVVVASTGSGAAVVVASTGSAVAAAVSVTPSLTASTVPVAASSPVMLTVDIAARSGSASATSPAISSGDSSPWCLGSIGTYLRVAFEPARGIGKSTPRGGGGSRWDWGRQPGGASSRDAVMGPPDFLQKGSLAADLGKPASTRVARRPSHQPRSGSRQTEKRTSGRAFVGTATGEPLASSHPSREEPAMAAQKTSARKKSRPKRDKGEDKTTDYEKELAGYLQERIKPGLNQGSIPMLARSIAKEIARRQQETNGASEEPEEQDEPDAEAEDQPTDEVEDESRPTRSRTSPKTRSRTSPKTRSRTSRRRGRGRARGRARGRGRGRA